MPKYSDLARGFARSMTADLLGGFGDTANNIENLGRAGYGYVGSKLGLLSPDELPELRDPKDAFLTSDWLAKNTPLEDTGSAEYTTGRLSSLLIPLLGGFAARSKALKSNQLGGILKPDFKSPQSDALITAQHNAALPVSKGGLGLRPDNTPMERAQELGYNKDVFHGTKQDIAGDFKPVYSDGLTFTTPNPDFASKWIGKGALQKRAGDTAEVERQAAYKEFRQLKDEVFNPVELNAMGLKDAAFDAEYDRRSKLFRTAAERAGLSYSDDSIHGNVLPLKVKSTNTFNPAVDSAVMTDYIKTRYPEADEALYDMFKNGDYLVYEDPQAVQYLKDRGYDAMMLRESARQPNSTLAVFDPKNIRSRFAAFDPFKKDSANILAGFGGLSIIPSILPQNKESPR